MFSSLEQIQLDAEKAACELSKILDQKQIKIVFAESCTAGLVSAFLAQVPGISQWHCGSAVVYQIETKENWLEVDPGILIDPGPVSEIVAIKMAEGVLIKTPQADISASITGHLGPNAPEDQDGLVYIGISCRQKNETIFQTVVSPHWLAKISDLETPLKSESELRLYRQKQATLILLQSVAQLIRS
jgi:nicotinamide-nucleotide amidase